MFGIRRFEFYLDCALTQTRHHDVMWHALSFRSSRSSFTCISACILISISISKTNTFSLSIVKCGKSTHSNLLWIYEEISFFVVVWCNNFLQISLRIILTSFNLYNLLLPHFYHFQWKCDDRLFSVVFFIASVAVVVVVIITEFSPLFCSVLLLCFLFLLEFDPIFLIIQMCGMHAHTCGLFYYF